MRLIDKDSLLKKILKVNPYRRETDLSEIFAAGATRGDIYKIVSGQEEVDAVPVVRCKDCEYWSTLDDEKAYSDNYTQKFCDLLNVSTHAGFYCALAERKTDGNDDN